MADEVVMADEANLAGAPQDEPAVIEKFVFDISKKILPTASTLILAVVVGVFGMVSTSVPSFGVLADSTVGNVCPPSVESDIFTFAQLIGERFVLFTLQV